MLKTRIAILALIGVALVGSGLASAQTTATISGTVSDETGGVLPGASVTAKNVETGVAREAVTDTDGRYKISALNIGDYEVTANMQGFQPIVRRGINLTIGREAVVDFGLKLGSVTESVEVTGDAPLVETRSGGLGGIVDRATILEIPLNGRDLTQLVTLQAGTVMMSSGNTVSAGASQGYSNKFSIGGSRVGESAVLLDGTDVKSFDGGVPAGVSGNFLGGEAIQEFKIERNSYSAEYGGAAGGVVNSVSKSGGNTFHGSIYGFTRNDALDAKNYFATVKPDFWRYQYGASAGGRIIANKTFYFGNFEGFREELGSTVTVTTLSAAGRTGNLGTRTVNINPAMIPYFALWPLPADAVDRGDGTAQYKDNQSTPTHEDFYQGRVDHNLSASDSVYGRYTRQRSDRTTPQTIDRWTARNTVYNDFATIEYKKIISSNFLNTFRFGLNKRGTADFSFESPAVDPSLFMVKPDKWLFPLGAEPIMGGFTVSGLTGIGLGRGWVDRYVRRWQYTDSSVYTRGPMTWKFGVDFSRVNMNGDNPSRPGGELTFGSIDFFLLGQPRQFRGDVLPETDWHRELKWNDFAWYVQNDWQVNSRMTVNVGLRHEFSTVPTEKDGKIANLKNPLTDPTQTVLGKNGDVWWENNSYKNFAPRVGVSLDPFGNGKTAVRGGLGIFFNGIQPESYRQFAWRTAPYALESNVQRTETQQPGQPPPMPFPNGLYDFIVSLGKQEGAMFLFPYFKSVDPEDGGVGNPHMVQYNVNVQHELLPNTAVTVGYAGSKGSELQEQVITNTAKADLINGRYVFAANAVRPNVAFSGQDLPSPRYIGKSWYNSFQVEVKRRFQQGWQLQSAYTYAKSIDTSSAFTPTFGGGASAGPSPYVWDQSLGKGPSAFDVRQRLSISGIWQVPGGNNEGALALILGGWQVSGIVNLSAGTPVNAQTTVPSFLATVGVGSGSPDLIAGGDLNPVVGDGRDPAKYFDATQFVFPATQ